MKRILSFFAFLFVIGLAIQAQDKRFNHPVINLSDDVESSFTEIATNGNNKVVLFWASWCGACKYELKDLEQQISQWESDYDVELVMVSTDRPNMRNRAKDLVNAKGWDAYTNVFDKTNLLFSGFKAYGLPLTLTVDGDGNVTGYWKGYIPGLMEEIDKKLKKMEKKKRKS